MPNNGQTNREERVQGRKDKKSAGLVTNETRNLEGVAKNGRETDALGASTGVKHGSTGKPGD